MQASGRPSHKRFYSASGSFRTTAVAMMTAISFLCLSAFTAWTAPAAAQEFPESAQTKFYSRVQHIIVIYQENWSFDSLYPNFPGANGISNAASTIPQVDKSGAAITVL